MYLTQFAKFVFNLMITEKQSLSIYIIAPSRRTNRIIFEALKREIDNDHQHKIDILKMCPDTPSQIIIDDIFVICLESYFTSTLNKHPDNSLYIATDHNIYNNLPKQTIIFHQTPN